MQETQAEYHFQPRQYRFELFVSGIVTNLKSLHEYS